MLAPRKTLWSTPDAIIDKIIEWVPLKDDLVADIGCGDGRVILKWACASTAGMATAASEDSTTALPSFVGIDIDLERIRQAEAALKEYRANGRIDPRISIQFHCANAMEATHLFQGKATVFFLYLIPRGLRKIKPILLGTPRSSEPGSNGETYQGVHEARVITYMSKLSDEVPDRYESIAVPHQPGAAWPLYLYTLKQACV